MRRFSRIVATLGSRPPRSPTRSACADDLLARQPGQNRMTGAGSPASWQHVAAAGIPRSRCRGSAHSRRQLDQPEVGVTRVAAVADHARDPQPAVGEPVAAGRPRSPGEAGHHPQHPACPPAPAPPTSSSAPVATARTARSATASCTVERDPDRPSSSSSSGVTGEPPGDFQDPLGPAAATDPPRDLASSSSAAKVSAGFSHRASSGHSDRTCWPAEAVQQDLSRDHLPAGSRPQPGHRQVRRARNHPPASAISCVDGSRAGRGSSRLPRMARPSCSPRNGGTALPIWRNAADGGPANRNRSGNVCSRAASRTVRVRFCLGWMYQ